MSWLLLPPLRSTNQGPTSKDVVRSFNTGAHYTLVYSGLLLLLLLRLWYGQAASCKETKSSIPPPPAVQLHWTRLSHCSPHFFGGGVWPGRAMGPAKGGEEVLCTLVRVQNKVLRIKADTDPCPITAAHNFHAFLLPRNRKVKSD